MTDQVLRQLLADVASGAVAVEAAAGALKDLPFADLGFAHVDHHRRLRTGMPEVIYGESKSALQIAALLNEMARHGGNQLATRVDAVKAAEVLAHIDPAGARYEPLARALVVDREPFVDLGRGEVLIVAAGTSDLPVAEEARLAAALGGSRTRQITDVGVAGLHRLLAHRAALESAEVLVVVAGMEGALPSVVAGLVGRPVIAVPTSVGYGASFGGVAALLGMLSSCAAGVTVVNIDNGFGAGFAAAQMNRRRPEPQSGR